MSRPLSTGSFKWLSNTFIQNVPYDDPEGYILEVDLGYPREFYDEHSDLPLAPENRAPPESQQTKLLAILHDKEKYVLYY